jgi:hypothetical protein
LSELDPSGRDTKDELKKFFLKDGAYQWQYIAKFGAEHTLPKTKIPVSVFGEFGIVYSYFTNINGPPNSRSGSGFTIVDTTEYPKSTVTIATIGFRVFP